MLHRPYLCGASMLADMLHGVESARDVLRQRTTRRFRALEGGEDADGGEGTIVGDGDA